MSLGSLVRSKLDKVGRIGIVIEIRDSIFVEDVRCEIWDYPAFMRVLYADGTVEMNPIELYEVING